jgi:hypothetical protein
VHPFEDPADIVLSHEELYALTDQAQPRRQYDTLLARGFWRVQLHNGRVILERAHYLAVCAGAVMPEAERAAHREEPFKMQPLPPGVGPRLRKATPSARG